MYANKSGKKAGIEKEDICRKSLLLRRQCFGIDTTFSTCGSVFGYGCTREAPKSLSRDQYYSHIRPSKKKNWLASLFQKFYGRGGGFSFFDSEVLMLKYNKTYRYLLSFLYPSVQAYCIIHKIIMERRKYKFSDN